MDMRNETLVFAGSNWVEGGAIYPYRGHKRRDWCVGLFNLQMLNLKFERSANHVK